MCPVTEGCWLSLAELNNEAMQRSSSIPGSQTQCKGNQESLGLHSQYGHTPPPFPEALSASSKEATLGQRMGSTAKH